ncbi:MAG: hypothetical protein US69_C0005G0005 [candidate division TM6 bacterium GW2011_GWF2_38_10]|nr:MAG: hypothetical protein US69_C0005G0005 [candidate division TM6 bacterium GW2011_GWF2_38_10]
MKKRVNYLKRNSGFIVIDAVFSFLLLGFFVMVLARGMHYYCVAGATWIGQQQCLDDALNQLYTKQLRARQTLVTRRTFFAIERERRVVGGEVVRVRIVG